MLLRWLISFALGFACFWIGHVVTEASDKSIMAHYRQEAERARVSEVPGIEFRCEVPASGNIGACDPVNPEPYPATTMPPGIKTIPVKPGKKCRAAIDSLLRDNPGDSIGPQQMIRWVPECQAEKRLQDDLSEKAQGGV